MSLNQCAMEISQLILKEIKLNYMLLPSEVRLKYLSDKSSHSPQNIGMAFDLIEKILIENGINARKCGKPVCIQISRK